MSAVTWDKGPLLVLAGPGSGKTRVLTCRIARTLDLTRDSKFRVLGLTFTNKAADEMRSRVNRMVPGLDRRFFLGTFHSFCADVLRQHGSILGINPNFNIYSRDSDLEAILDDAVEKAKPFSNLVTDNDKKTLPVIKRLKATLVAPENCRSVFRDAEMGERMAYVYPAYENELRRRNALDFDSLILDTSILFQKYPVFAKRYRAVYKYCCVDEFQDSNLAQYTLLHILADPTENSVFVVADDDQIIYQWNGASHERIIQFTRDYTPGLVQLPMVYRCPPEIVKLANNLIQHNFLRQRDKKPLEAFKKPSLLDSVIRLLSDFEDEDAEAEGVASDILQIHSKDFGSVVVLGRSKKLLQGMEVAFRKVGVPAFLSQRKDEFESIAFIWLHFFLHLVNDRQNEKHLTIVCSAFGRIADIPVDPSQVIAEAEATNRDYALGFYKMALTQVKSASSSCKAIVEEVGAFLRGGIDYVKFSGREIDNLKTVTSEKGEADVALFEEESLAWKSLAKEITDSIGPTATLDVFLQELDLRSKEPPPNQSAVILMTIHGAKGKEFSNVYLIGMVDDELPSFQAKRRGDESPEMEEERRNCFVAITRTLETLTLSYAETYRGWTKKPSRFLFEMGLR